MFVLPLLTAAIVAAAAPAPRPTDAWALVVTNNRSLEVSRPDLHYADDDGVKYAQLFSDLLAPERVSLLTRLDPETTALYPEWTTRVSPPNRENLDAQVAALSAELARAREQGRRTTVYLVLAGHGDLDRGQGYLELEDQRLTARALDEELISRLPADRIHLILDSCNSWFMLNPRKPGGRRWVTEETRAESLLERHPHVGAVISTSAEAVTYEWSEVQSGIFSYEVRSALRGAADADGDRQIHYRELGAFLDVANRTIPNGLYRPKIFTQAPADGPDAPLLVLPEQVVRALVLPEEGRRRLTVRDAHGVRVLDLHKESGTAARLLLPSGGGALAVYEQLPPADGEARPTVRQREVPGDGTWTVDDLVAQAPDLASRGEAPVFAALFAEPFGKVALAGFDPGSPPAEASRGFGVSRRDVERLARHLRFGADGARNQRLLGGLGLSGLGLGLGAAGLGLMQTPDEPLRTGGQLLGVAGAAMLATSLATFLVPSDQESLLARFEAQQLGTDEERARAVLSTEALFRDAAMRDATVRPVLGYSMAGFGALAALSGTLLVSDVWRAEPFSVGTSRLLGWTQLGAGAVLLLQGLYYAVFARTPVETAWKLYEEDVLGEDRATPQLQLTPSVGIAPGGGVQAGLQVRF